MTTHLNFILPPRKQFLSLLANADLLATRLNKQLESLGLAEKWSKIEGRRELSS